MFVFGLHPLTAFNNKKHLKNVGPIRNCEPPHAHSPRVATVARRLRIDVHDNDDDDNDNDNDSAWQRDRYGPIEWAQQLTHDVYLHASQIRGLCDVITHRILTTPELSLIHISEPTRPY